MSQNTPLKLLSTNAEVGNVRTFVFEPGPWRWVAGQCLGFVLPRAGAAQAENERWFTIASAPSEGVIHVTTRVSDSAFKQALAALQPGEEILTHDLGGDFTWETTGPTVIFVAGGIGVTPFRSILVERKSTGKPLNATMLYFNRNQEIPFQALFSKLAREHPEFKLGPVVGQPVTPETILELVPAGKKQTLYLSGPEPMVESVGAGLREHGVTLKQDWFPGYDEKTY
jgi:ferredoxin-NADP reductase